MTDTQYTCLLVVIVIYGLVNVVVTAAWGRHLHKLINERR